MNVDARDRDGATALHMAAEMDEWELANALLEGKADPSIKDKV